MGTYVAGERGIAFELKDDQCAIMDVMTDLNHRRRGLYCELQDRLLEIDAIRNNTVILHTMSNNRASMEVHKKLGYVEIPLQVLVDADAEKIRSKMG